MNTVALIIALLEAGATAVKASGVSDDRVRAVAELVRRGMSLAGTARGAGEKFIAAMQTLTAQVKAMHDEGRDDLTDVEHAALDKAVQDAHEEIQAS